MASVLAVMPMVTGFPQMSATAQPHPVKSQLRKVGLAKTSVAALRVAKNATPTALSTPANPDPITTARAAAVTPVQNVAGAVTVVGVTWPKGAVNARSEFQIRTFTGASWGLWQNLDSEDADGPDAAEAAGARGGTSPFVVTGASKYEVRSLTTDATAPTAATVQAVDPGTSGADSPRPAGGSAVAATIRPAINTRAAWGANEGIRRGVPSYGKIMVGFTHHTDSQNNYAAGDVPAMIRGMYAYHVQSLGWSDIGYNFLVDRFGRIWEGRYGGMEKAVVGAQTMNYNSVSMGVSAIGNFDIAAPSQAMTNAFKQVYAWKLGLTGIPATGTVVANGKLFQRLSGHRDGFSTACPGRYLYPKLSEIRAGASAIIAATPRPVPPVIVTPPAAIRTVLNRDVDRNGLADVLSYRPGAVGASITGATSVLAGALRIPVRPGVEIGSGWNALKSASLSRDLNGDKKADIIALDPAGDRLRIYLGNGRGGFAGVLVRGPGWRVMDRLLAAGDRNGDGRNDILATKATGQLVFYPGNGAGALGIGRVIGSGWTSFKNLTNAGDLNRDSLPDLLATRKSDGALVMYAGVAGGSIRPGVVWAGGWGGLSAVAGGSDLDADGYRDLVARAGDGMRTYSSDATGRFVRSTSWGAGWAGYTQLSTGADWNGDGASDLMGVTPVSKAGSLRLFAGTGQPDVMNRAAAFPTVPGADLVRLVGDVNGDGYVDAVARVRTSNTLVSLLGRAGSLFAAPRPIGSGWNSLTLIQAAGDYDGDRVPDLLARDATGRLSVYPLTRNMTFKARRTIGVGFQGMRSVVGTGAFDRDTYSDLVALRTSDKALILFRGTASSGLLAGTVIARAQVDVTQILGVGDYNGDGGADLIARAGAGSLWLYPGNRLGGVTTRKPVRGGQGADHVLG